MGVVNQFNSINSRERWQADPLLAVMGIGLALCLAQVGVNNLYRLNPDGIAYLRIAGYWASGDSKLAISGYWGPLLSWMAVPFLWIGLEPLAAGRAVMALSAFLFWAGSIAVFQACGLGRWRVVLGSGVVAMSAVEWSAQIIAPDLLATGLMTFGTAAMLGCVGAESTCRTHAIKTGVLWGIAYYAKAAALPIGVASICLFCFLRWLAGSRKPALRFGVNALGTLAACSLPWVLVLSLHYGKPTFSTSAKIAHAVSGPPNVERYHPFAKRFHKPEPGRLTSWEDPSRDPYQFWSPFDGPDYARHQLNLILGNAKAVWQLAGTFDPLRLGLLGCAGLIWIRFKPRQLVKPSAKALWLLVPASMLCAAYIPIYIQLSDQRYLYFLLPCAWAFGAAGAEILGGRNQVKAATGLLVASLAMPCAGGMLSAVQGTLDPASLVALDLAERLRKASVSGAVAGSALLQGGRTGLYLAFHLGVPWHGDQVALEAETIRGSGALLYVANRRSPGVSELAVLPGFVDLDGQLLGEESQDYPVKILMLKP